MPALPDVPSVLKVVYEFSDGLDFAAIVREYFSYAGTAPTDAVCDAIAADIYAAFVSDLIPLTPSGSQILGVTVTDLTSPTSGTGVHSAITGGSRAGLLLTGGSCVLTNKHIARRYRGGKPRSYWPFFTVDDILTPQTWKAASVSGAQSAFDSFYAAVLAVAESGTTTLAPVNVSYYSGFTVRPTPPIAGVRAKNISTPRAAALVDPIASITVHSAPASQRRRTQTN